VLGSLDIAHSLPEIDLVIAGEMITAFLLERAYPVCPLCP